MYSVETSILAGSTKLASCVPPPGKPKPSESWPSLDGQDPRSRIPQAPQKEGTCWYYAMNGISRRCRTIISELSTQVSELLAGQRDREAIGFTSVSSSRDRDETPATTGTLGVQQDAVKSAETRFLAGYLAEYRKTEKRISRYRKKITKADRELSMVKSALASSKPELAVRENPQMALIMKSFYKQNEYDDLLSFATERHLQKREDARAELLVEFHVRKGVATDQDLMLFIAAQYGLLQSAWHPMHPITSLMEQLNLHGPHVVFGRFGSPFYKDKPIQLSEQLEGRPVFCWPPGAERVVNLETHAITIVGARSDTGKVYYTDPNDGSDPADIATQKIYVMSYEEFISNLTCLNGMPVITSTGGLHFLPAAERNPYALYGERFNAEHFKKWHIRKQICQRATDLPSASHSSDVDEQLATPLATENVKISPNHFLLRSKKSVVKLTEAEGG